MIVLSKIEMSISKNISNIRKYLHQSHRHFVVYNYGMEQLNISLLGKGDQIPYDLLLEADPNKELVDKYIKTGECYLGKNSDGELVGLYVLVKVSEGVLEIINVSVDAKFQGQGYGKMLVSDAIERAKKSGAQEIEIGTGNSSFMQLSVYQKCGFRIVGVDTDFFVKNYPEPIFENGIQCRDMVRLAIDLTI